jgi:hypothetical protein
MTEKLRVDGFSKSSGPPKSLDTVGLPAASLSLLRDLTQRYILKDAELGWDSELMKDEGHGVAFLLHGKSGVDKKYTAGK